MKGRASNEGVGPGYLRRSLVIMGKGSGNRRKGQVKKGEAPVCTQIKENPGKMAN